MSPLATRSCRALALSAALSVGAWAAVRARPTFDLDVAVPPGSPLEWGRAFPGYTPHDTPLFPVTGGNDEPAEVGRTRAAPARGASAETEVRFASSFGMLRILTWDLAAHLGWIQHPRKGPASGPEGLGPRLPGDDEPLYWVSLAPLLRLLLHPEIQSTSEALAHLVEIGTPVRSALDAASAEKTLEPVVATLRRLVPVDGALPVPSGSGTPRERMLARFTLEELLRHQPYDPTGEFGKRLFLFADEVEPWLTAYAEHPARELSRAAVTALGRYRTPRAAQVLVDVAAGGRDPVTVVRALAALGAVRARLEVGALIERLRGEREPALRAALIGALGRLGSRDAVALLLELGEDGFTRHDSDLLISVVSALARIWPSDAQRDPIRTFVNRLRAVVGHDTGRWRSTGPKLSESPDVPDLPASRAEILGQLADFVLTQTDPGSADVQERLLGMARSGAADARVLSTLAGLTDPIANLHPPVRFLYLEALARLDEAGQDRLQFLARSPALESAERGRALSLLRWQNRSQRAPELFRDHSQDMAVRIEAFETLLADHHDAGATLCRETLAELAATPPGVSDAAQRYLHVRALRYLGDTGRLTADDLLALLPHVRRSPAARTRAVERVRTALEALVEASERRGAARRLDESIRDLFDLVVTLDLRPEIVKAERKPLERALEGELAEVPTIGKDPVSRRLLVERWVRHLTGPPVDRKDPAAVLAASVSGAMVFQPSIPLEEEIVLGLGRTRSPGAAETLLALLRDESSELRAWVCLAIGMTGFEPLAPELCAALEDPDPFVRFSAYESVRRLAKQDLAIDWMYAPPEERRAAAEEYRRCLQGR